MTTLSSTKHSPLSIRAPGIVCKHPESASSTSESPPAFLPWSPLLCTCLDANDPRTQDPRSLYHEHTNSSLTSVSKCSWFTQAKRAQESYHLRKHELKVKNKLKKKMKQLTKQKKKARLTKKRAEEYTCRRCKHSAKFDSNTKLHEHIRSRHAKKPKQPAQQSVESVVSPPTPPASSSESITSSPPSSPKLLPLSIPTPEVVRERSESVSPTPSVPSPDSSSVATPRKPISWAEIASRPVVAPKPSRLPIATPKSVCKPLENASIACPPTPPRTPSPKHQGIQKPYLTVDDLFRMFAGKPSPFGLQRHQMRSFSPRGPGKCSPASKCGPIQSRITSYFHAVATPASKSAKSEAFGPTHARGNVPRQFSVSPRSASPTSFPFRFPMVSRPPPVCRHCQGRSATYRPTGWAMPSASRVENNGIPMGMRYWRFAPLHPALGEY
ncbi:hypothetical protein G7Y79_00013g034320 [Physcia stellaris]|nr:hypothetical protein G7Y79_00013g034320 [Physcia stellaris]